MASGLSNAVCTAYHYTSQSNFLLCGIEAEGLKPYKNLIATGSPADYPEVAYQRYVFAFINDPSPRAWRESREFPGLWERVMKHVTHSDIVTMLGSFTVTGEDAAFVADWIHMQRVRAEMDRITMQSASEADRCRVREANQRYVGSVVELGEFLQNPRTHILPELMIANCIVPERITWQEL